MIRFKVFLSVSGCLAACNVAQAQLSNDKGVAQQFINWNVAWNDTPPSDKKKLKWLPKARTQPWTISDSPYTASRRNIDQMFKQAKDRDAIVNGLMEKAQKTPSAINNFSWGYAEYIRTKETHRYSRLKIVQEALNETFVLSAEYIRLMFLRPYLSPNIPTLVVPIGERLLAHSPQDKEVQIRMQSWLTELPTEAARQQSISISKDLISQNPRSPKLWSSLGFTYHRWWSRNVFFVQNPPTPSAKPIALSNAKRDAKLAIYAYNKSIALSPKDSTWRQVDGPKTVETIQNWLQKSS